MSHTLHRRGKTEDLRDDYVVFAIAAQGINSADAAPKFTRFFEMAKQYYPKSVSSLGDMRTGNIFHMDIEKIQNHFGDNTIVHAVFTNPDDVAAFLKALKEEDLGVSIVVSGLVEQTAECCHKAGIEPHTVEYSMGIWGKTELLPAEEVLEISTMCGHGMVAFGIIKDLAEKVKAKKMTAQEAGQFLAKLCHCGVFNPVRAERILERMAE